ncbi:MAG: phosphatase PAP2 family protein [Candidatus Azobacteroides sp.]|nr:phosphatase PAP2 family protein [Candidatus Azobacteroides sp.]
MHFLLELIRDIEAGSFLFLNGYFRHSALDFIMWWASDRFIWIPLYIFFLWKIYQKYPKHFWLVIISCSFLILLNDQLGNIFKYGFERLRPTHDLLLGKLVNTVKGYQGGKYGFYSAHAANSFAIAMFVSILKRDEYTLFLPLAFSYATLVSFSRIYLGVHYPSDIVTGAFIGIVTGWFFAVLYLKGYGYLVDRKKEPLKLEIS